MPSKVRDKAREREYQRRFRERHPGRKREDHWRERGIALTFPEFEALWRKQGEKCAACRVSEHDGSGWHVDHCHDTGQIRGILCRECNLAMGLLGDSLYRISALLEYLGTRG